MAIRPADGRTSLATVNAQAARNLCLVALSAVGVCQWNNNGKGLERARTGVYDWSISVNCYSSVLFWAIIAGALTSVEQNNYIAKIAAAISNPSSVGGAGGSEQVAVRAILWDAVGENGANRAQYTGASIMPLGAMVYFGGGKDNANPLYHVGVHVGNDLVVGACMAVHDHPEAKRICSDMMDQNLNPTTTLMTISQLANNDFSHVYYTKRPFFETFPRA
jgi:hypothetical protein